MYFMRVLLLLCLRPCSISMAMIYRYNITRWSMPNFG